MNPPLPPFIGMRVDGRSKTMIITQKIYLIMTGSGVTWHGACISFFTTDSNLPEGKRYSKQCQLPQTSHRILHNPYALFGLGRSVIITRYIFGQLKKKLSAKFCWPSKSGNTALGRERSTWAPAACTQSNCSKLQNNSCSSSTEWPTLV